MSTHTQIYGIVPPDKNYQKMKAVWDVCTEAGIEVPDAVKRYFEHEEPDGRGMKIKILSAIEDCSEPHTTGVEVNLSKIPEKVKLIRFVQSW